MNDKTPEQQRWHVGREIPLALVGAILFQTCFFVYWFATFSAQTTGRIETLEKGQVTVAALPERMARQESQIEAAVAMLKDIKNDVRDLSKAKVVR